MVRARAQVTLVDTTDTYMWVKYADTPTSGMADSPQGKKYIGVAYNKTSPVPSTEYSDYAWTKILGEDGIPGEKGEDGKTSYLHIKYSNDGGITFTGNNGEDVGSWMGTYTDFNSTDSTNPSDYTWHKIKGEDGYTPIKGIDYFDGKDGRDGTDGASSYLHIRYSQNADGSGMNSNPSGALYIGIAVTTSPTAPTSYTGYQWSLIKGTDGIPGEHGEDGRTSYLHIKYSNDGGSTFTANNGETVGIWMGTYVDFTEADSSDPSRYTWNKVRGDDGYTPVKGIDYFDGVDGKDGVDGLSSYLHVRYSQNSDGSGFIDNPTNAKYVGIAVTSSSTAPTSASAYQWSLIKGTDGIPGEKGEDGRTSYLHVKYSNDGGQTFTGNNGEDVGTWMGTYVDFTKADSNNPSDYTWNKVRGEDGYTPVKGIDYFDGKDGRDGVDGTSSYLHVRYSQNSDGNPMTPDPAGAKYVGIAVTPSSSAPTTYSSYQWSLIKGTDGIKGEDGKDGVSNYLHIKYSDDGGATFTGNNGEDVGIWIGTYVDTNPNDSNDPSRYTWNKVRGDDGVDGKDGVSVDSIVEEYYHSTSATNLVGGQWTTTVPDWVDGKYVWTRAVTTFSDGTTQSTSPVNVTGSKGSDGVTTYTWIKYADDEHGNGLVDLPNGKRYIGIAYNKTTPNESTNKEDYAWSPLYDNVKVGGRNLYRDSFLARVVAYAGGGVSIIDGSPTNTVRVEKSGTSNICGFIQSGIDRTISLTQGVDYTLSFEARGSVSIDYIYYMREDGENQGLTGLHELNPDTFTRVEVTKDANWNTEQGYILIGSTGFGDTDWFEVRNVKLEKGNIATDWTPAPEDIGQAIDDLENDMNDNINTLVEEYQTAIEQRADEITLYVGNTVSDAEDRILQQLETEIIATSESFNVQFSQMQEAIEGHEGELNEVKSYFNFNPDNLTIGRSDSPLNITISNEEIDFLDNGTVVAYINGQKMYIDSLEVLSSLIVGVHKIEKYNENITLIKWVGE